MKLRTPDRKGDDVFERLVRKVPALPPPPCLVGRLLPEALHRMGSLPLLLCHRLGERVQLLAINTERACRPLKAVDRLVNGWANAKRDGMSIWPYGQSGRLA